MRADVRSARASLQKSLDAGAPDKWAPPDPSPAAFPARRSARGGCDPPCRRGHTCLDVCCCGCRAPRLPLWRRGREKAAAAHCKFTNPQRRRHHRHLAAVRPNTTVPARSSRQMVGWSAGRRLKLKKTRPAPAWQPPGPAPYPTAVSVQVAAAVRFSSHLLRALVVTILGSHIPDKPQQANARNVAAECGAQPPQSAQCSPQG